MSVDGVTHAQSLSGEERFWNAAAMSPEQLEGTDVDARTDIFAFGAVWTR